MSDIVITEFMDQSSFEDIKKKYQVLYDPQLVDRQDDLLQAVEKARAIVVRNRTQVDADLLDHAPALKVVGRLGVGLDNIDLTACRERGVAVCPATGANDDAVAEWVIVSVMTLLRGSFLLRSQMLNGEWPRNQAMGYETAGKTLGLIGFGQIARVTAKLAQLLGMTVVAYDPYVSADDPCWESFPKVDKLEQLLERSDAVSLHVPLNDATRHLLNSDAMAHMKKGAVLVNAARGGIVDEKAMIAAMKSGHLAGAALDVYESEPLTKATAAHFEDMPNLILTPHIGGVTVESNQRVSQVTMANVIQVLEASS